MSGGTGEADGTRGAGEDGRGGRDEPDVAWADPGDAIELEVDATTRLQEVRDVDDGRIICIYRLAPPGRKRTRRLGFTPDWTSAASVTRVDFD